MAPLESAKQSSGGISNGESSRQWRKAGVAKYQSRRKKLGVEARNISSGSVAWPVKSSSGAAAKKLAWRKHGGIKAA